MTTITIKLRQDLKTLKDAYRAYYNYDKKHPVTKHEVATWLASLVEADVEDYE